MPAEGIHLTALREALASPLISSSVRRRVLRREDAARLGAVLVDLAYFDRYAGEVVRYVAGLSPRSSPWGARFHDEGPIELLACLARRARRDRDEELGAVALGLASHASIDRSLHPLVNALARLHPHGPDHGTAHREVEKFQSILFHERYVGRDLMGEPAMSRHLHIAHVRELGTSAIGRKLHDALTEAYGHAPSMGELARFGRGYRAHVLLLASPIGKHIAPAAAKERARPLYFHGRWGDIESALAAAVERSVAALEAVGGVLDATDADEPDACARLFEVLPRGTIDPQGENVSLDVPFVVGDAAARERGSTLQSAK